MDIKEWQRQIHQLASEKGWWRDGKGQSSIAEKLLMIHSEVSEATEELRVIESFLVLNDVKFNSESGKPEGFGIELADIVIRVLDLAEATGVDIERMMQEKHDFNCSRPHRHGDKNL